jgi:hypothetical protein
MNNKDNEEAMLLSFIAKRKRTQSMGIEMMKK